MTLARRALVFATHLAPNIRSLYEFVVERVGAELGMPARLVTGDSYQPIREGMVDFVFLCGLPYVFLRREDPTSVEAIAAPIVGEDRYGGRPIYVSDVIVGAGGSPAAAETGVFGPRKRPPRPGIYPQRFSSCPTVSTVVYRSFPPSCLLLGQVPETAKSGPEDRISYSE